MTLTLDALTIFFALYCLLYNLLLFFYVFGQQLRARGGRGEPLCSPSAAGQTHRSAPTRQEASFPILTILIPALNEGSVLRETVRSLFAQKYPGQLEVLIVDDHSEDETAALARELSRTSANVYFLQRNGDRARRGKADVLNHGFDHLSRRFPKRDRRRWVIGVFDADGTAVESDFLEVAGRAFLDPTVAAAQSGVRIRNRHHLLAALQDVEFTTFSAITQTVRDGTSGAVALGGNGQFVRADYLERLKPAGPWNPDALTEDLELGIKLSLLGGRIRFLPRHVAQEGVESFRALMRQRKRWAWGTLQVFTEYVASGRLLGAPIPLLKRLDLHYYLSFWIVPLIVLGATAVSMLSWLGVWQVQYSTPLAFMVANSLSFWPMMALGMRRAGVPWRRIPFLMVLTTLYSYHWIPALAVGWYRILIREKPQWAKTQRIAVARQARSLDVSLTREQPLVQGGP